MATTDGNVEEVNDMILDDRSSKLYEIANSVDIRSATVYFKLLFGPF